MSCGETELLIYITDAMNQIKEKLKGIERKDKENQKPSANKKKEQDLEGSDKKKTEVDKA